MSNPSDGGESIRARLVERTYSDDEQNVIILTHATPDGEREFRKERADLVRRRSRHHRRGGRRPR